jgi:hypothetical protein
MDARTFPADAGDMRPSNLPRIGVCLLAWISSLVFHVSGGEILWPQRSAETNSPLIATEGVLPPILGRFGQCQIYALDRDRYLVITAYDRERGDGTSVSIAHAGGTCRLPMRRHNGSIASFQAANSKQPRGLFVYLTGIIGLTPPEETLVDTFRAAGWHTLVSETSFNFMQRRSVLIDPADFEDTARDLGRDANDHLADKAYAVEAMLRLIAATHPNLALRPRILAGGSAGSIALPTVAARIGHSEASILIGAGGNVGRILCESSLEPISLYQNRREDGQVYRRRLSDADLRRVGDAIYAHTPLDPLRLASVLRGRPVLLMRAELDRMVPAETNDLLWNQLGRPHRWSLPVNHLVLFGMLQFQSGTILKWTEQALLSGGEAP